MQTAVCLGPAMASNPPRRIAETVKMKTAMVEVLKYLCAWKGLTTQKHRSLAITADRKCDTHVTPVIPVTSKRRVCCWRLW